MAASRTVTPPSAVQEQQQPLLGLLTSFAPLAVQACIVLWLVRRFRLENDLFQIVMAAGLMGFFVHYFLPKRWKLASFAALSAGVIIYALGLEAGRWNWARALRLGGFLFGAGGAMIGLCHLPFRFPVRAAALAAAGAVLAYLRGGIVPALDPVWAIFGAMFMFRIMVYAYDSDGDKEPFSVFRVISYFFLFPNLWLYVAPVLDYKTYRKCYYNQDAQTIYLGGFVWMVRGIIHLLLWRLVYYQVYVDPSRITNGTELAQFLLGNVALYLRLSGQFHIMTGLMHLYGFHLPPTHHNYFLAASFVDYWRRVNIYWKDFIVKIFYYPLVVRFKSFGVVWSVIAATILAFAATWALHPYQAFWIRGSAHLAAKDAVFWGALGIAVCVNSFFELKAGRKRTLGKAKVSWRDSLITAGKTSLTFTALMVLWAIWTCDSLSQWLDIWSNFALVTAAYCFAAMAVIALAVLFMEGPLSGPVQALNRKPEPGQFGQWRFAAVHCILPALFIFGSTSPRVTGMFLSREGRGIVESVFKNTPNKSDEEFMVRGYYEDLADTSRFQTLLNDAFRSQPKDWLRLEDTKAMIPVSDFRTQELAPSMELTLNGKLVRTNRWGMRDSEVGEAKPANTFRVAVLGASHEMGLGVNNGETFADLLEARLNTGNPARRFEVLNFAVNHYSPVAQVEVMRQRVTRFQPDVVLLFSHREDVGVTMRLFAQALRQGADPARYPFLASLAAQAGVNSKTPRSIAERRLIPHWPRLVEWAFQEVARECRRNGIKPVWILQESVYPEPSTESERLTAFAKAAGFTVASLGKIFEGHDPETLVVAPWDTHPNAAGHKLIEEGLYRAISAVPGFFEKSERSDQ